MLGSFTRVGGAAGGSLPPSYSDGFQIAVTGGAITITQQSNGAVYAGAIGADGTYSASNGTESYSGLLQPDGTCPTVTNSVMQAGGTTTYSGQFVHGG